MPLPAISPHRPFTETILPGLIPMRGRLTHVMATYHRIGSRVPVRPAEVCRDNGLTALLFSELGLGEIQSDVGRVILAESDPSAPLLATVYVGGLRFVQMMQLVAHVLEARPDARVVTIACPHITEKQETTLRRGIQAGKLAAAAWCDCGGTNTMCDIRRAVEKNRIPDESDIQLPSLRTTPSASLGA